MEAITCPGCGTEAAPQTICRHGGREIATVCPDCGHEWTDDEQAARDDCERAESIATRLDAYRRDTILAMYDKPDEPAPVNVNDASAMAQSGAVVVTDWTRGKYDTVSCRLTSFGRLVVESLDDGGLDD